MTTLDPYGNANGTIRGLGGSLRCEAVDISTAAHTFTGELPRALYVNNTTSGTSQNLAVRFQDGTVDVVFQIDVSGVVQIAPEIIRQHASLTVVAMY